MFSGGETPCPKCNTEKYLLGALDDAKEDVAGSSMGIPWCAATVWEGSIRTAIDANPETANDVVSDIQPFTVCDWPDRDAVFSGKARWQDTIEIVWQPNKRDSK